MLNKSFKISDMINYKEVPPILKYRQYFDGRMPQEEQEILVVSQ